MKTRSRHILIAGAVAVATTPAAAQVNVALVGDSITRGQWWLGDTYPEYLEAMFDTAFGEGVYHVAEYEADPRGPGFGHSGATLRSDGNRPYIQQDAYAESLLSSPDIVVMMLGTNDARLGTQENIDNGSWNWDNPALDGTQTSLERFLEDYQALIDVYDGLASQPDIVVMSPIPVSTVVTGDSTIDAGVIENEIAPAVRNDVANFAAVDAFLDLNLLFPEDNADFYPVGDNIHPDEDGYAFIAQQVFDLLTAGPTGDLNGDDFVGVEDLDILVAHWGQTVTAGDLAMGDVTGDTLVDDADLAVVLGNWGGTRLGFDGPAAQPIPEPASALALLAGLGLVSRRRR